MTKAVALKADAGILTGGGAKGPVGVYGSAGVPMRTLQEWMGHKDIKTTQRYADYAPSSREADMIAAAFARESAEPVAA